MNDNFHFFHQNECIKDLRKKKLISQRRLHVIISFPVAILLSVSQHTSINTDNLTALLHFL